MNKRLAPFRIFRSIAATTMVAALALPGCARAINIGEIALHSKLGEPLLAQVELTAESSEHIGADCLSLTAPEPHEDNADSFLTRAQLSIKTSNSRQYVIIRSQQPFTELFAKLRLQVKCPGMGSVARTLTILPDLDGEPPDTISAPVAEQKTDVSPASRAPAPPTGITHLRQAKKKPLAKTAPARNRRSAPTSRKAGKEQPFRLKLSGDPIDESRIGKISAEERELLLARQKLLDADDQMADFLALQHQVKQLQDELGEIKLRLAQLGSPLPAAAARAQPQAPAAIQPDEKPALALERKIAVAPSDNPAFQRELLVGIGLLLSVLLIWKGLRRYSLTKAQQAREPILKQSDEFSAPAPIASYAATPASPAPPAEIEIQASAAPVAPIIPREEASAPPAPEKDRKELTEEDAMLEEAELYAVHGHPNKAVEILREIVTRKPSRTEAWELLLSVFSAQGKVEEFERAARNFLAHNKNSNSWKMIQALGRTLAPDNPLYAGKTNLGAAAMFLPQIAMNKRRPVGDILVELGAISTQDLQTCLANFNPKVHGRFGGYLISRKLISHAQLNDALMMQQEGNDGAGSALPTLQDMENLLAGFDPKRDGSIGEYLVSQKLITPVQLDKVLRQQHADAEPDNALTGNLDSSADSPYDSAFEWDEHPEHDKLHRTREIIPPRPSFASPNKLKPPEFELTPLIPPLPDLDLPQGNNKPSDKSGKGNP